MSKLPTFIIIGVIKGGTSGLYHSLIQHPQIAPAMKKELRFWSSDHRYKQGLDFYKRLFMPCFKNQITCEASPSYILHPKVAQRIAEDMPWLKLIIMLRNPVDRALSQYRHYLTNVKRFGWKKIDTFEKFLDQYKNLQEYWMARDLLERGHYAKLLKEWFKYIPKSQFRIVNSDRYFQNSQEEINKICDWLFLPHHEIVIKNPNRSKIRVEMKPETREKLRKYYEPYNQELYKLLGRNFKWETK